MRRDEPGPSPALTLPPMCDHCARYDALLAQLAAGRPVTLRAGGQVVGLAVPQATLRAARAGVILLGQPVPTLALVPAVAAEAARRDVADRADRAAVDAGIETGLEAVQSGVEAVAQAIGQTVETLSATFRAAARPAAAGTP